MATRDPQLVHHDQILSRISVGYTNAAFVGDVLAPNVRVAKQSDKYYEFTRMEHFQIHDDRRVPGAFANEVPPMTLSKDSYFAEEHSLAGVVPWEERENADAGIDPYGDETARLSENILLNREDDLQTLVRNTANYASGHSITLSGTDQWSDYANSDPKDDIKTARKKIYQAGLFREPNVAVMGYDVAIALEDHTQFVDRIKYTTREVTSMETIAQLLGVGRIVVGGAGKDTANPGADTASLSMMWGKDVVLAWVPPNPGRKTPAFMYEFVWPYQNGQVMPTERWSETKRKSDVVRVSRRYDLKMIATDANGDSIAGYLIKNAVA